jgi:hypothetical protein
MGKHLLAFAMMTPFLAIAYYVSGGPVVQCISARSWEPVPCTILYSGLDSRTRSGKKTKYRIKMRYEYVWGGETLTGDTYSFSVGRSAGRPRKQAVVDAHPTGSKATCFVNPENPGQSVFDRGFQYDFLYGAFPLMVPALVLAAAIRNRLRDG